MILKDRNQTRIKNSAVTSFALDQEVYPARKEKFESIRLTIGSCLLIVLYNSKEERDQDVAELDKIVNLED